MSHSLCLKQATIEDLDQVAQLFNEYRVFYKQESDLDGARQFLFERFVNRESVVFLVLDEGGNVPVGFTQLYPVFSSVSMKRSLILNDLYVREQYRKRKAGKMLLDAAQAYARQTESKGLELSTSVTNETAQRLYELNGYIKDDGYYHYYLSL